MSSKVKLNSIEVCAVCLLTDVPMVKITATERSLYLKISGLQVKESKIMPHHFCQTCYSFLEQSKEFRKKCQIAHQIINKIHLTNGQLSKDTIRLLDRKALGLEPPDIPIKKIEIEVDFDQTDEKKPILNSNTNEFSAIVKIEHEDEDKGSVFVFNEPIAKDDDDSDDDGFNIDDSMDAGDNETPEPSSKVPPSDSKRKSKTGLKVADKFDIKCMSHADLDIQIATKSVAAEYVDKQFKCDLCFTGFKKETSYKYHMHRHEYGVFGIYQCDICKKFEKSKVMIYRHIRKYHYFKYTCHICKKIAYSTSSALFHYMKKHGKVSYTCRFCNKKFKTIHTLSTHTKYSHSSVPCDICGDCFVSEKGKTYHKKYKHRVKDTPKVEVNEEDPLYCKVCNTLFQNDDALYNHLRKSSKHTAEDARGLAKNSKLFRKRVFNEPRAMQCNVCSQEFPNFNQAIKHYKSLHPDTELPRQHMCDLCGKSFTFLASLLTHRNTHTKDEVYKCSDCSKTFSSYTSRARHTARLHREKSFECSYCNSKFAYNFELKLHIQTVHMKIPYLPRLKAQKRRNEKRKQKSLLENEDV